MYRGHVKDWHGLHSGFNVIPLVNIVMKGGERYDTKSNIYEKNESIVDLLSPP
jgi:hypothetical protein